MARLIISSGILMALLCAPVQGQGEPAAEAGQDKKPAATVATAKDVAGQGQTLTVSVKSVSGSAEVRESSDKSWRAVKVKDVYQEGAEIRTGYRAKVELTFADNSHVIINRISHFRVDKFRRSGNKVVTRSHLSYGALQAGVEKGPAFSDYKITTSLGTLGVNGTRDIWLDVDPGAGYGIICLTQEGGIDWNIGRGSDRFVDPGGCTDHKGRGQDQRKHICNNINLVPFGSTGTEQGLGSTYGNQGSNS
ncbi:MAG: FecR domain-containing protein, partial [Phycisphaerae bacterium]|nr:FecR domain-containing protein [Phycisphaerae bacterium]